MNKSVLLLTEFLTAAALAAESIESGFANPPQQTRSWCYWYWISDHLSKEGITRDLEGMARVGIGEAFIGNIHLDDVPAGSIKVLTPEWWALVEHAIREGGCIGVNIGMFNCPGWCQSGGPWEVQFAHRWGTPERTTFVTLESWTAHTNDDIRHFSGAVVYRKTFELPSSNFTVPTSRILLALGSVRDLATVRVNGQELGTCWLAPFQFDLTEAARPGSNTLEIEIVNVWSNRLVGDAALPADQRKSFLLAPTVKKDAALLPAGLLGPVRLLTEMQVAVRNK